MSEWQPIETAPKNEMFIWAAPKGKGRWSLGLAYRNVSGGWSDAYGSDAPERATHWMPLPEPPNGAVTAREFGLWLGRNHYEWPQPLYDMAARAWFSLQAMEAGAAHQSEVTDMNKRDIQAFVEAYKAFRVNSV